MENNQTPTPEQPTQPVTPAQPVPQSVAPHQVTETKAQPNNKGVLIMGTVVGILVILFGIFVVSQNNTKKTPVVPPKTVMAPTFIPIQQSTPTGSDMSSLNKEVSTIDLGDVTNDLKEVDSNLNGL